jgi:hypothetical protein
MHFVSEFPMHRKARPRNPNLLLMAFVVIAVLLILLRMIVFVTGHGHHRF